MPLLPGDYGGLVVVTSQGPVDRLITVEGARQVDVDVLSHLLAATCAGVCLLVLRELQIVLAVIFGACPLCRQPVTLNRLAAALTPT